MDLALNDLRRLICHKPKQTNLKYPSFCRHSDGAKNTPSVSQHKIYNHMLGTDTVCHLDDLPSLMADIDGWLERVKAIFAVGMLL